MDDIYAIGHLRNTPKPPAADASMPPKVEDAVARRGEVELAAMVTRHQQQVARMARRLLGDSTGTDGVEDVVQEVFLAALANIARFRGDSSVSTWLAAVTVNKCRSLIRRQIIRRRLFPWTAREPLEQQPDRKAAEEESNQTGEEVRRAVYRLPQKYRETVVLRYFESMSIEEIAKVLGLAPNTVEVRLSRARKKLKDTLQKRLIEP